MKPIRANLVVSIVPLILVVLELSQILIFQKEISYKFIIGGSFLLFSLIVRYVNLKTSYISLGLVLLAGSLNLISFGIIESSISINNILFFDPFTAILLIIYIQYNWGWIKKLIGKTELSDQEITERNNRQIQMFKRIHSKKSIAELEKILLNKSSYTAPAIQAVKELIQERKDAESTVSP